MKQREIDKPIMKQINNNELRSSLSRDGGTKREVKNNTILCPIKIVQLVIASKYSKKKLQNLNG